MEKSHQYAIIAVVAVALAAYVLSIPSDAEKLRNAMVSAVDSARTYKIEQEISVFMSGEVEGSSVQTSQSVVGQGATDLANRRMYMDVTLNTNTQSERDVQNISVYFIGDTTYVYSEGGVDKRVLDNSDIIWSKRTQIRQQADLMKNSKIELLPEDEGMYVIKVKPDAKKLVKYITDQSITGIDSPSLDDANVDALAGMMKRIEIFQWIGKNDNLPRKFTMNILLSGGGLERETNVTLRMYDYNIPVTIELPELEE
ncbi:MAG: hypothetical protein V1921_02165 [Candidatus Altiarchaeota archaeon]